MRIVCLCAKAQHGKDFAASILKEKLEQQGKKVLIIHFADYLKFISREYFGWDGNKDEKGRTILQQIGTEKIRTRDPDFHVGILTRFIKVFAEDYDYFLISDCRFSNEIEYPRDKKLNVISLHIERLNFENSLTPEQRQHRSEIALDNFKFDYYLESESGREAMEIEVDKFVDFLIGG